VKLDALADFQLDRLAINPAPFSRQSRDSLQASAPVFRDQPFPERREKDAFSDIRLFTKDVQNV
jgi:hypothetical protein